MIELTENQAAVLSEHSESPVTVMDPKTKTPYVLLRQDLFERLKNLLCEDGDWTTEESLLLLAESGRRAGWTDPDMDAYDNYDENRKKMCQ